MNAYTGGTQINGGILNVAGTSALGATGNITFTGGTLQYSSGIVLDQAARVKNSTAAVSIDASQQDTAWAGTIDSSNTGGLTLVAGNLTLSGNNSYTGVNTITAGALKVGNNSALSTGAVNMSIASTLDLNGYTIPNAINPAIGGAISSAAIITNSSTTPATINGDISATGGTSQYLLLVNSDNNITLNHVTRTSGGNGFYLEKNGTGTLTLSGTADNSWLYVDLNAGTLVVDKGDSGGVSAFHAVHYVTVASGTLVQFGTHVTSGGFSPAAGQVDNYVMNGGTVDLNGASGVNAATITITNGTTGGGSFTNSNSSTPATLTVAQTTATSPLPPPITQALSTTAPGP